jgi:hypothetical protein
MRADGLLERLSAIGAAAQATVPGVYAWGVTVAPAAWARGASPVAKAGAISALVMLAAGVAGERRWLERARTLSLWGFVVGCAVSWSAAPAGLTALRIDASRGLAGMVGWALFAFASAAPALRTHSDSEQGVAAPPSNPSSTSNAADVACVVGSALLAAILQTVGWRVAGAERALLVRFIALAAGLGVIGTATELALQRHAPRQLPSRRRSLRRAVAPLIALAILVLAGLLNAALD